MGRQKVRRFAVLAVAVMFAAVDSTAYAQAQPGATAENMRAAAEQLMALANQARAEHGAGPLKWDAALAEAALYHCRRMAAEGELAHRYGGEPDLAERAGKAGAHFSLIEENIALGSYVARIHEGWMNSPAHRENLLNPSVNRVGIAVLPVNGIYYAVADYTHGSEAMTAAQVEAAVAGLMKVSGVSIRSDPSVARAACATDRGLPNGALSAPPDFVMRWQNPDLSHLPQELTEKLASGRYQSAAVGSCPAQGVEGSFTVYRVAVLLYGQATQKTGVTY